MQGDTKSSWRICSEGGTLEVSPSHQQLKTSSWSLSSHNSWSVTNQHTCLNVQKGGASLSTEKWKITNKKGQESSGEELWKITDSKEYLWTLKNDGKGCLTIYKGEASLTTDKWKITNKKGQESSGEELWNLTNQGCSLRALKEEASLTTTSWRLLTSRDSKGVIKKEVLKDTIQKGNKEEQKGHKEEENKEGNKISKMKEHRSSASPKCHHCGKTVYPMELLSTIDKIWHRGCFRCEFEGCSLVLNLSNYATSHGKIFCHKHQPKEGSTVSIGDIVTQTALSAPKPKKLAGIKKDERTSFGPLTHHN